jgi:hypothetical protein
VPESWRDKFGKDMASVGNVKHKPYGALVDWGFAVCHARCCLELELELIPRGRVSKRSSIRLLTIAPHAP